MSDRLIMTRIELTANYLFEKYEQNESEKLDYLALKSVKKVRVFHLGVDIIIHSSTNYRG